MGEVSPAPAAMPWRGRSAHVWSALPLPRQPAGRPRGEIEGWLARRDQPSASDIVSMRVARHCGAACLLVTNVDRAARLPTCMATWALLPEDERALIRAFVLSKFGAMPACWPLAPQMLQDLTGIPTVATIPMQWHHGLPEEDGVFDDRHRARCG